MAQYTITLRKLEWNGSSGTADYGNTSHNLTEPPDMGVPGMLRVQYVPDARVCRIEVAGESEREMTRDECLEVECRLYHSNRGAADPWRKGWTAPALLGALSRDRP